MKFLKEHYKGFLLCLLIAVPSWLLGKKYPVVGGAVIAIIAGMILGAVIKDKKAFEKGVKFTSKKVLQWAVILLGFGMDLGVVVKTGVQSLPIIISTITTSLVMAFILQRVLHIPSKIATLVGVGSSICGGSAIAATAPVIDADDDEVAQAISVIFFFNVLAALIFPYLGQAIGFSTISGEAFGIFAGTAVNDTSSVTAAANTWDEMFDLGSQTLDKAVTVKLTRTLAIIPITLVLAVVRANRAKKSGTEEKKVSMKKIFPFFILYFIAASVITTVAVNFGVPISTFESIKTISKFFIVLSMAAIGFNTDIIKLVKTGGKPLILGAACWTGITIVSLVIMKMTGSM